MPSNEGTQLLTSTESKNDMLGSALGRRVFADARKGLFLTNRLPRQLAICCGCDSILPICMPKYLDRLDDLIPLAEGRDGYFTTAEAAKIGINTALLAQLERAGHIERELPAVYRLARWPAAAHPGLWPALLWAESKSPVAFSHRTALALHGLSDVNPAKIELTFLGRMPRIRGATPTMLSLRARTMAVDDITQINWLPVTRLKRTLVDLILDGVALDAVDDVLEDHRDMLKEDDLQALTALRNLPRDLRNYVVQATGPRP